MSQPSTPDRWQTVEPDAVHEQVEDLCAWTAEQAPYSRRRPFLTLSTSLSTAWPEFMSFERRAIYEHLLEAWVQLIVRGELNDNEWRELQFNSLARRVGKTQTGPDGKRPRLFALGRHRLELLQHGAWLLAAAYFPAGDPDQTRWEQSFFADGRVTTIKLQRLGEREFDYAAKELETAPMHLSARCRTLEASGLPTSLALPSADALFLHAHDAFCTASSRFARFSTWTEGLVIVYRAAYRDRSQVSHAVQLEGARDPLKSAQQADAFATLPLALQVSAVDHARDLVFDACKRIKTHRELLTSERMIGLLGAALHVHDLADAALADLVSACSFADEGHSDDPSAALAASNPVPGLRRLAPRSLSKDSSSRFFPVARSTSW